ncbi:VOC family protein [Desulfosporosinus sp. BICA1-9]|uniref:VOC family protein n=1 Tax=Desulfosporosinus sp. BICA1-9 TaxID=1531958 RepID=UPI00054C60D2|nr:VOC family protein [Desulfosporosinus sp. BICA1-9]KJS48987.1 MAG: 3-demethylubiquinone-9 3-methyltransferase [Peptococcaceae bacterium BRH_c23]KJS80194.1 MAG: 3-demethylubiquinone-9 3-methyltransferase [Desulfosporosinus sp. BICA1-9]HBW38832.1 VOC family protein [Desulfosporosinus sp.]
MSDWLVPYLVFNGNCEEAVNFYQGVLGGESQILHFSDAPPNPAFPVPEEIKNFVLHAELRKDGHVIRFSDTFPNTPSNAGNNISFSLEFDTKEETKAMFEALSVGGNVEMDLNETFFSPLYGKFTDKFGIRWQVSCKPR